MSVGPLQLLILHIVIICSISEEAAVIVELEQSGVLYVCHGEAMTVTCSTSADLLRWNVTVPLLQNQRMFERQLSYIDTIRMAAPIMTDMAALNVSRSLNNSSSLSLISTISTDNTTADLNGTIMTCSAISWPDRELLATASVEIILVGNKGGNINNVNAPNINTSKQFGTNNITVTLQWTHKNEESYSISVDPAVDINYTGRNSAELVVMYDNKYNVSVVASLCGTNRTTFIVINQMTCPRPQHVQLDYVSHSNLALVGTLAAISCPPGMVLFGPNVTTCMENQQWYPDPKIAMCKGKLTSPNLLIVDCSIPMVSNDVNLNFSSTLENSLLVFRCKDGLIPDGVFTSRCYRNGSWIPNPSSHTCATSSAANCGEPSPPSGGYVDQYTSTIEGARVNRVHVCQYRQLTVEEIVCGADGQWESISSSSCPDSEPAANLLAIISGLLGSLLAVALLVCGILIVAIVVIARKRGTAVSSSGEQRRGQSKHQNPEYEEVMASRNKAVSDEAEELEMMKNVAYGPLQLR